MKIKLKIPLKILALLMAVLMFSMPFVTLAQQNYSLQLEAKADADADADARTNKIVWFLFGCAGGVLAVAGTYLYEPSLPAGPLLGKSPEYVAFYTDAYTEKAKALQVRGAMTGCVVSTLVWAAVVIAAIVAAEESSSSGYYYYY